MPQETKVTSTTWWAARAQIAATWLNPANQDQRNDSLGRCSAEDYFSSAGSEGYPSSEGTEPHTWQENQTPAQSMGIHRRSNQTIRQYVETLRHADTKEMDDVDRWVFGRQEMFALDEGATATTGTLTLRKRTMSLFLR